MNVIHTAMRPSNPCVLHFCRTGRGVVGCGTWMSGHQQLIAAVNGGRRRCRRRPGRRPLLVLLLLVMIVILIAVETGRRLLLRLVLFGRLRCCRLVHAISAQTGVSVTVARPERGCCGGRSTRRLVGGRLVNDGRGRCRIEALVIDGRIVGDAVVHRNANGTCGRGRDKVEMCLRFGRLSGTCLC